MGDNIRWILRKYFEEVGSR